MTTLTKEQCIQWARESGAFITNIGGIAFTSDTLHAFALKVLAESEDRRDAGTGYYETCWTCVHRIGEECGYSGREVYEDTSCEQYTSSDAEKGN